MPAMDVFPLNQSITFLPVRTPHASATRLYRHSRPHSALARGDRTRRPTATEALLLHVGERHRRAAVAVLGHSPDLRCNLFSISPNRRDLFNARFNRDLGRFAILSVPAFGLLRSQL